MDRLKNAPARVRYIEFPKWGDELVPGGASMFAIERDGERLWDIQGVMSFAIAKAIVVRCIEFEKSRAEEGLKATVRSIHLCHNDTARRVLLKGYAPLRLVREFVELCGEKNNALAAK